MRLLVLADDPLARAGLVASLASQPDITIVGQREPGAALDAEIQAFQPDAIVWDLGWDPHPDAAAWLRERTSPSPVLSLVPILALLPDAEMAAEIWAAGVRGLARRDAPPEELLAALQALTHGLAVVDPELAQALLPPRESPPEALAEPLTPRESEVLQLLADGLSNKAIARDLGISEHTVKFHVNAIMTKLDAQSRTDAVVRVEARRGVPATGVLWNDTLIVTAHHALERDDHIPAGLGDGRILTASLVGRDPTTDIAVLRVEGTGLRAPVWADPTDLRVGHLVLALGRPGRTVQATLGVVSALGADWRTPMGGQLDHCLQTDVLMYPGFSGGPLVNAMGQVLGMNTSAVLRGISLTIPTPTIRRVVETLLAHGRMRRGYLGIGSQPVRLPESMAQHVGQDTGLLVVSVEPGSPADQAGLLLGDVIVAFDGQPTRTLEDLLSLLDEQRIGKSSPVRLVRGGQAVEAVITVGER